MMKQRTFNTIFVVVCTVAFLPLIFPLFAVANQALPIVLGLPFNFFWVVLWVLIVFAAVIVLYFVDPENKAREGER
jgi:uncharacterized membrane protein